MKNNFKSKNKNNTKKSFNNKEGGFSNHNKKYDNKTDGIYITGKNVVFEAIKSNIDILEILVCDDEQNELYNRIDNTDSTEKYKNIIKILDQDKFNNIVSKISHNKDQKIIARIKNYEYCTPIDIIEYAHLKDEKPFIIILDEITDPMNFGSIIRSANLAGVHGIIIKEKNSCEVNNLVANASSGAVFHTKIARVTNLSRTIEDLKKEGMWFAAADMDGENIYESNITLPLGLVIGSEGFGISRLVKEKCDYVVSIPMKGDIDSLNASVSAGILMFEIIRKNNYNK